MSAARQPRVPFAPLFDYIGPVDSLKNPVSGATCDARVAMLAARTGVNRRKFAEYRHDGIPLFTADKIACALGAHASEIWPQWYDIEVSA